MQSYHEQGLFFNRGESFVGEEGIPEAACIKDKRVADALALCKMCCACWEEKVARRESTKRALSGGPGGPGVPGGETGPGGGVLHILTRRGREIMQLLSSEGLPMGPAAEEEV